MSYSDHSHFLRKLYSKVSFSNTEIFCLSKKSKSDEDAVKKIRLLSKCSKVNQIISNQSSKRIQPLVHDMQACNLQTGNYLAIKIWNLQLNFIFGKYNFIKHGHWYFSIGIFCAWHLKNNHTLVESSYYYNLLLLYCWNSTLLHWQLMV